MINDKPIINGTTYKVEDIANLPSDLAAYKAAEKSNDTHIVLAGDLSPYSNLHRCPFTINGQQFHSSEQWIQYQKALAFGDSFTANMILQSETPMECKRLSIELMGSTMKNGAMKAMKFVTMVLERNLHKTNISSLYSKLLHLKFLLKLQPIICGALALC